MDIERVKERAIDLGCEIIDEKKFSITARCAGNVFLVKNPDARLKVLVKPADIAEISAIVDTPKIARPREITIGKFNKQGAWSRVLKLGDLDEVEYFYGETELRNIKNKSVRDSIGRIDRANKFAYMTNHEGIDPPGIVRKEVDKIADHVTGEVEAEIAKKTDGTVICGSKNALNKSWNSTENDRYRFAVKVNCKVPAIHGKVLSKIESIGSWHTMSESDRFYIKSIMPPSKDMLLTGIKVFSPLGTDQFEFELVDDDRIKKKNFLENATSIKEVKPPSSDGQIDVQKMVDAMVTRDTGGSSR